MLTLAELPMPVQGYILWDVAWFPRGSIKDMSPMCHLPLQHGLRQATQHLGVGELVHGLLFIQRQTSHRDKSLAICHLPICLVATQASGGISIKSTSISSSLLPTTSPSST